MTPAFVFQLVTVVSLTCAVSFHGSFGFKFKPAKRLTKQLLLLTVYCLLFTSLSAQTDSTKKFTDTSILEPVTVTAFGGSSNWKDAPAAVALINKNSLQRFDNKTLVPILNTVAGVRMEER